MKKFLAVFDGYKMSNSTLDYAIQLSRDVNARLTGVFLDEFIYRNNTVTKMLKTNEDYTEVIKELDAKDQLKRDEAVQRFQKACDKAGIRYSVHRDKSIALQELKHGGMLADLIIINEYETFTKYEEELPTRFMKDLLGDVQSPVLLVSNKCKPVEKIALLYDGAPSSLYAIKMFSYLFGNFQDLPVEVFSVNERIANLRLPDNKLMREFIKRYFPNAAYNVVTDEAEEQILDYLPGHKEDELVVLGAYRRSELS